MTEKTGINAGAGQPLDSILPPVEFRSGTGLCRKKSTPLAT